VSVASNIVEGKGRYSKEFVQFLYGARGSLELQTQLFIARELDYLQSPAAKNKG
jgi:four helix bundle protein